MNLRKRVLELEKRVEELEKMWEEHIKICPLFQKKETPSFIKIDNNHQHKKSGQKNGHKGYTRETPARIDFIKPLILEKCPECGGHNLSKVQEIRKRIVTDIPLPQEPINTEYKIERRYCKDCKKLVEAQVPDALPNARFGLRLMLFVAFLKLGLRMPSKKIVELMEISYNLIISDGEIYKVLEQLSIVFGFYYKTLKEKIRKSAVKYIDETGWRVNGKNSWLWIFINKEVALYAVRKQRSSKTPIAILRKQKDKTIVSDRLRAYTQLANKTKCKLQICWTHILRNSKNLAEHYEEAKTIHRRLKSIYKQATLYKDTVSDKQLDGLLKRIDTIVKIKFRHSEVYRFVKSVCRNHRENLFRFVNNPEIESTNNRAERGLRHAVVIRKISNGNRSKKGAEITSNLLSIIQTLKLQDKNPITGMQEILLQNSKL